LLQQVSIVAFPAGVHGKPGVAEQIIQPWLKPTQTCLPLNFPYVQDEAELLNAWSVAAREIWQPLSQGRDLVFVSEGDASFYSTFTYLAQMLRFLYPAAIVETIPGVCSPLAAVAAVGCPCAA